jgi:hypothetical protein
MIGFALNQTHKKFIKTYKGSYYKTYEPKFKYKSKINKIIVFDLDETLGHFTELHIIYKCLVKVLDREITQAEFNLLLDLFPEFLRPGILNVLKILYQSKREGVFSRLFLYTNNQCAGNWVRYIINYFHYKIGALMTPLFEDPICAFKIRNKIVNIRRTSQDKSYNDLIHCAVFPPSTTEVCFIDNTYYEHMRDDRVYYILPKSYHHALKKMEIMRRLNDFDESMFNVYDKMVGMLGNSLSENTYEKTPRETEMYITKKIMYHVREFLYFGCDDGYVYNIKPTGKTVVNRIGCAKAARKTRKKMDFA